MVPRLEDDSLFVVVNAACKDADLAHMRAGLPKDVTVEYLDDRALLALQGPAAVDVMVRLAGDDIRAMPFMSAAEIDIGGFACFVTRSGYTGEAGFEISVAASEIGRASGRERVWQDGEISVVAVLLKQKKL